jgi:hypothetical protein
MGRHNRDVITDDEPETGDADTGGIDVRVAHARRRAAQVALAGEIEPPTTGLVIVAPTTDLPVTPPRASPVPHRHRPSRSRTPISGRHRRPSSGRHCR